jgi:small subunit ribosomal protein S8
MSMTDPIADLLTRIRNGLQANQATIQLPLSRTKLSIVKILADEGYIRGYEVLREEPKGVLEVTLKYGENGERILRGLKRVSSPGRRVYENAADLRRVLSGIGIGIVSTSQGIMTDREAREKHLGGEVMCEIW